MLLVGRTGGDEAAIALPGSWARSADDGAFDLAHPTPPEPALRLHRAARMA